jgi:hypothetical protein
MKKFFVLTVICALALAGCGDGDGDNSGNNNNGGNTSATTLQIKNESTLEITNVVFRSVLFTKDNADIIGTWTGRCISDSQHALTLNITDNAWSAAISSNYSSYNGLAGNGQWTRNGNSLTFKRSGGSSSFETTNTAILSGNTLTFQGGYYSGDTYTLTSNDLENVIKPGTSATKNVEAGSGYIFFRVNSTDYRTNELVIVENKEKASFTFLNNTLVVDVNDPNNTIALGGPRITVKQGDTVIEQQGEYSFGTVRTGTTKEVTFTIENTGGANLTIETVNGNKINLTDNTTGFFNVNLQPLSSTVAPGNNTTFTIRFAPTTLGNNIAATVQIKTNNQDFVFRVIGNCSNTYQIGDTGPGGGMVFYTEGGQYKECSGELGTYNWSTAVTTASSYSGNGFTNWRLPDRGELDLMYENLHRKGLGGFTSNIYWSSTDNGSTSYAYYLDFSSGNWSNSNSKSTSFRVRAVRSFTL